MSQAVNYKPWLSEDFKNKAKKGAKDFSLSLICGGGAGATSKTATAPLERIKMLLQSQKMSTQVTHRYTGLMDAGAGILKREGFLAFWKGNSANIMRIIPAAACKFSFNDIIKKKLIVKPKNADLGTKVVYGIAAGSLSGTLTYCVTYPLELARTRMCMDQAEAGGKRLYNGVADCLSQTMKAEGFLGMYKGFVPTVTGGVPYLGMSLGLYDIWKGLLLPGPGCIYGETNKDVWWYSFAALGVGAWNGIVSQTASYPMDTIRRRMALDGSKGNAKMYSGMVDCAKKIVQQEGVGGLYLGCGVNAIKAMPSAAIQFFAYDQLKVLCGIGNK